MVVVKHLLNWDSDKIGVKCKAFVFIPLKTSVRRNTLSQVCTLSQEIIVAGEDM